MDGPLHLKQRGGVCDDFRQYRCDELIIITNFYDYNFKIPKEIYILSETAK